MLPLKDYIHVNPVHTTHHWCVSANSRPHQACWEWSDATNVLITNVHSNVSCNHMLYITGSLINLKTHGTAKLSLLGEVLLWFRNTQLFSAYILGSIEERN